MAEVSEIEDLLRNMAGALCEFPEEIEIVTTPIEKSSILFLIKSNAGDRKMIIGYGGRMITAIRTVIQAIGSKNAVKIHIAIDA